MVIWSLLPSVVALGLAAMMALVLTRRRRSPAARNTQRRLAARALAVATSIQAVHFGEELATGFHQQLGSVFGLPGIPLAAFVVFNLGWLGIWAASVPALQQTRAFAFFAAWFLAIAGMINGIAHPLLAVAVGSYFPGLVSSPFIGMASIWLWLRLWRATA